MNNTYFDRCNISELEPYTLTKQIQVWGRDRHVLNPVINRFSILYDTDTPVKNKKQNKGFKIRDAGKKIN